VHTKSLGEPIRPGSIQRALAGAIPWRQDATAELMKGLQPRVVVVGGAYDNRVTFLVAGSHEPVPGGVIHVAGLISGIDEALFGAWLADVALGTVVGLLFLGLWTLPSRAKHFVLPKLPSWYPNVLAAHCELAVALAVWVAVLAPAALVFKLSGWLMECGLWLNPGPMIAGIVLHTLLVKEEQEVESEREHRTEPNLAQLGQGSEVKHVREGTRRKIRRKSDSHAGGKPSTKAPRRDGLGATLFAYLDEHPLAPTQVLFVVTTLLYVMHHGH